MKENFISFLWKYQFFDKKFLTTSHNQKLKILNVGRENDDTGPDFFNAQVIIEDQHWAGNIEIHSKASDWYVHGHEQDVNYDSVILHVVWENDIPIYRENNTLIPTLVLKNFINKSVISKYSNLFSKEQKWINCEESFSTVDSFTKEFWLERLFIERLEQKSIYILELLNKLKNDWEALLFVLLLKNFGLKVNSTSFYELARQLDYSIVRKESFKLERLEALFFGTAGLLHAKFEDPYYQNLQKEFHFLKKKYDIKQSNIIVQFFRLRPNNFPTIRLAQFANIYHMHTSLFSQLINATDLNHFYNIFDTSTSKYWDVHYTFEAPSKRRKKKLTKSFIDLLLINTIIPLKFVYHKYNGKTINAEIIDTMRSIDPEKNVIIDRFKKLHYECSSAFSSQALLELKTMYCAQHKCLQCAIGKQLLSNKN